MLSRFAPLVPLALVTLLIGCAAQSPVPQQQVSAPVTAERAPLAQPHRMADSSAALFEDQTSEDKDDFQAFTRNGPYQLPVLADSILERGKSLIGTRYQFGGMSENGFDCTGFINFLFREEAGMTLPRSSREMINVKAPVVARNKLKPGDVLFFGTTGRRGRVSHAGIYLGDDQFIHSSSRRSGGVRVDNLGDTYWSKTYIEAKRMLAMAPTSEIARK